MKLGKEFIKKLYTVDNPDIDINIMSTEQLIEIQDGFSPYLTKDALKELSIKRTFLTPMEVASALNNTFSVQNISLNKDQEKDESFYFDHSFSVIFTDQDGKKVDERKIKGQLTIINTDDGFKIKRYREGENLMNMRDPNN